MGQVSAKQWITIPAAAALMGVGCRAVKTLIAEGRLTVRDIPSSYPRVLRSEVLAIAEASTRYAITA